MSNAITNKNYYVEDTLHISRDTFAQFQNILENIVGILFYPGLHLMAYFFILSKFIKVCEKAQLILRNEIIDEFLVFDERVSIFHAWPSQNPQYFLEM